MLRHSQNLLLGLLFLLQGIAPLTHAHAGTPAIPEGIHVDGLSEALGDAGERQGRPFVRESESPGFGVGTPKRNDETAVPPVGGVVALPATLTQDFRPQRRPLPLPRATSVAYPSDILRPALRAPPPLSLS